MIVQLVFSFDADTWEGLFDRIEVWRSRGTSQGPYEPMHGAAWAPARLPLNTLDDPPSPAEAGPSTPLVGKKLDLLIDERTALEVTFTGTDPLTFGQAATQIQTQSAGKLTAFAVRNILVVQTVEPGLKATLRCVGGDAAPLLGLPTAEPGSLAFGRDARIVLKHGEQNYGFLDSNGDATYFYKARFFNSVTGAVNEFSLPVQGTTQLGLDVASLCRCYVNLVDMTGTAAAGQEVLVYNKFNGTQVSAKTVVGGAERLLTDASGHAEVFLARGAQVTVAIGGTSLARDVTVPTDPAIESLDLLAAASGTDDLFSVQVPAIPFAARRSL